MSMAVGPAGDLPGTTALPSDVAPAVPAVADEHICVDVSRVSVTLHVADLVMYCTLVEEVDVFTSLGVFSKHHGACFVAPLVSCVFGGTGS